MIVSQGTQEWVQVPCALQASDKDALKAAVKKSGTSFYWAMRLLPEETRYALFAVYVFCREVDDIADGDLGQDAKLAALDIWRSRVSGLFVGEASDAVSRCLVQAISHYGLVKQDFIDVIDGMEMDARGPIIAPSHAKLDLYCDRVASAVGRLCVPIFGVPGEPGRRVAHHLGRALQLTNILRDVYEDAELGRLYLPEEALAQGGVQSRLPHDVLKDLGLARATQSVGAWAKAEFEQAEAAIAACDQSALRPAIIMKDVYQPLLWALEADNWRIRPRADQPRLTKLGHTVRKLWVALSRSFF